MKKHNISNKLRKLHLPKGLWVLFLILFFHSHVVQAGNFWGYINNNVTYHVYSAGTGNQFKLNSESTIYDGFGYLVIGNTTTEDITVNFVFHTTNTILVPAQIRIERGTVNMSLASDYAVPAGQPTLKRVVTTENLFHVHNSQTDPNKCQLNITGLSGKPFIIDGGADITYTGKNAEGWSARNTGMVACGSLVLVQGGKATLDYVDLRNNWFYLDESTMTVTNPNLPEYPLDSHPNQGSTQCEGSAVHLTTNNSYEWSHPGTTSYPIKWTCQSHCVLTMTNCNISKCVARRWGSAIGLFGPKMNGNMSSATLTDCTITDCFNLGNNNQGSGPGGTIRTAGNTYCSLKMTGCTVSNNKANCTGGGVFWETSVSPPLEMTDCEIEGNYTSLSSGGVDLRSPAVLTGCKIRNNYAKGVGGGLTYQPYAGPSGAYRPSNYFPKDASITLDADSEITGNHSETNGGGMHINVYPMSFAYSGDGSQGWTVFYSGNSEGTGFSTEQYKINIELNGATISGNSADGNGGGIYMQRNTDIYQTNMVFDYGKVENNTAGGVGGACYILSNIPVSTTPTGSNSPYNYYESDYYATDGYPSTCPFKNTNMYVELGSATASGNLSFTGNAADFGGGLYVDVRHSAEATSSVLNTTVFGNAIVGTEAHPNIASAGSGGAMYINNGNILLKGGEIKYNTATVNGGGIYPAGATNLKVDAGDFDVQHNTVNGVPNNLYLPTNKTIEVVSGSFDPKYLGLYTEETAETAKRTKFPVFTVSNAANYTYLNTIYEGMRNGTMNVIDDRQIHSAQYTSPETILYFGIGSPWSPYQQTVKKSTDLVDSNGDGVYEIGNVKQLTAFLWYANGITTHDASFTPAVPGAKGILTADINMENHYWEPFADYSGSFDGNGHVITGITMVPSNASSGRGLFGTTAAGADIKNVTLDDCQFFAPSSGACYVGSIVSDLAAGTVRNSVANPGTQLFASGNASAILGGLAGKVSGGTLHSSIAMTEMTGYTMGGLVGEITSGNLFNSFANPKFTNSGSGYMGGLVAVNNGTVENCYVRLQGSAPASNFGWLVGQSNNANVKYCYIPNGASPYKATGTDPSGHGSYGTTSVPYLYNHRDNQITLVSGTSPYVSNVSGADKQMLIALNKWVTTENTKDTPRAVCTYWLRPTTKTINDDLPILRLPATNAVAATDGEAYLDYNQVNELLTGYTTATKAICLYGQEGSMNSNSGSAAPLYIDQEATLVPASTETVINGYTSQMINKYESSRWHDFSSPLRQSDIGFTYHNTIPAPFGWTEINPCSVTIASDDAHSLFPSDLLSKTSLASVDLYCFYEPEYHWLNLKRASDSHWHMNATTVPINYVGNGIGAGTNGNETYLVPGKGYLVSIDVDQLLQNYGTLNNGDVTLYSVTKSDYNAWAGRLGFNLLGNPYQSYLNFEEFKSQNASNLWAGDSEYDNTYAIFDPQLNSYVQYKAGTSYGAFTASQYIHPHQGFFIRMTKGTNSNTTVKYTNSMRSLRGNDKSQFRGGEQPAYPLINFVVNDSEGNADIAVLELGRTEDDGATKMRMNECKGMISLGYGSEDFGILFRTEVEDYQSLRFEAAEEGIFTLTWNTANAEFDKLTLIDNIAGTTTDMLGRDSYSFEATPDQYASRFKVVIGDYKGIDELEVSEPVEGSACNFAFQMGDQLVVNGEGNLQIIDMLGRVVMTDKLTGSQSTTSLPTTAGVYVLRLTDTNGTRTQKMVIR